MRVKLVRQIENTEIFILCLSLNKLKIKLNFINPRNELPKIRKNTCVAGSVCEVPGGHLERLRETSQGTSIKLKRGGLQE